jgi:Protein of unknown function (DUF3237)
MHADIDSLPVEFLFSMNLTLGRNALMPNGPHGTRVFAPVNSGTLSGPKISGTVFSGADWVTIRADSDRRWGRWCRWPTTPFSTMCKRSTSERLAKTK